MRFLRDCRGFTGAERALLITIGLALILLVGFLIRAGTEKAAGDARRVLAEGAGSAGAMGPVGPGALPRALNQAGPGQGPARIRYESQPTLDQILADPYVNAELQRAWNESNPNAPEVPAGQPGSTKQEQGGWIVWNRQTGQLEVIRRPGGTRDGMNPNPRPPDNDQQVVVAFFHTHPNTSAEGYSADPSPADINYTNNVARVPGIIETHEGRKIISYNGSAQGGCSATGRPGEARDAALLLWAAALLLVHGRRLRAQRIPCDNRKHRPVVMRSTSLYLALLLGAVPAALGCQEHEKAGEMADKVTLPAEEQQRVNKVAEDYVTGQKGWKPGEFRIEPHGVTVDRSAAVVWAVHRDDERSPTPGGGKSLVLHIDRKTLKVVRELRFQ